MQLTVFTSPLIFFFNHGLMCFSQVPLLSLTVDTHTNAYIFITMKSSKPNQLIAPMNFTLLFILSPFINQIYVLEKFSVSKTDQISDLWKLYRAKKAFYQPKIDFSKFMYNLKIAMRWVSVSKQFLVGELALNPIK